MTQIGIMQGRLVPPTDNRIQCFPREHWADEFALASQAGLDCIEWIYDFYGADVNPLATDSGVAQMKHMTQKTGVQVLSICADYFMERPLVRATAGELAERLAMIDWLLANWDSYVGVSFLYRTDPTKTAADLGYPYLPQEVVTEAAFRTYSAALRPLGLMSDIGGAVDLDQLDADCEGGACPIR